jgi:hypothetical protein
MRAEQFPSSFVEEFDEVPTDEKDEQDQKDDINVDQQNKQHVARQIVAVTDLGESRLKERKDEGAESRRNDDNAFPPLSVFLVCKRGSASAVLHGIFLNGGRT